MAVIIRGLRDVYVTETRMSLVDGEAGRLIIGGWPVEAIAPNACYEEMLHVLWHDRLPNAAELKQLRQDITAQRALSPRTIEALRWAADKHLPPMDALRLGADTLCLEDPAPGDRDQATNLKRAIAIVARFPTIVATYWRLMNGQAPIAPTTDLGHAENFLYMLDGKKPHPEAARGLETYLNTVIDHGMNNSTFTARVIISTRTDMYSAIVGAVGAMKGPLHGGAPEPAMDMVFEIRDRAAQSGRSVAAEAEDWVRHTLSAGDRIMGFGHRVYKVRDPRCDVLGAVAGELLQRTGKGRLYEDARTIESAVLRLMEEHRPGRGIKTNVEFYTALVLHGVGLTPELFPSTFAISRVGGWTAHVFEQIAEDQLVRPQVAYVGSDNREWVPLEAR